MGLEIRNVIASTVISGTAISRRLIGLAVGAAALGVVAAPAVAQEREIIPINITYDVANNVVVDDGSNIQSPSQIAQETFVQLNLRLILNAQTSSVLQKSFDGGYTSEPSGCAPGDWGPMAMEKDLRYTITTPPVDGTSVQATIYPGDRSVHWANDAFCEFDEELGEAYSVARITGFFFVLSRRMPGVVDVQLRAIAPSQGEVIQHLKAPQR